MEFHTIDFCGTKILTTVTCSAKAVDQWISGIYGIHGERMSNLIVGLDIEWLPFNKYDKPNPVAIIQICVGHRCLIFQLLHADFIPKSLRKFFVTPEFTFVGVGVKDDADKLFEDWSLRVVNTMDLAHAAAEKYGVKRKGLKKLAIELLGKFMQKPIHVTMSEWNAKKLSREQVEYACIDAYVSFKLGMLLKNEYNDSTVYDSIMEHHYDPYNYGNSIMEHHHNLFIDVYYDDQYNYDDLDHQWYDDLYHYEDPIFGNPYGDLIINQPCDDQYHYDASIIDQYVDGPYSCDFIGLLILL